MLTDSCYKTPAENDRVFQDSNPIKFAALEEAKARLQRNTQKQQL